MWAIFQKYETYQKHQLYQIYTKTIPNSHESIHFYLANLVSDLKENHCQISSIVIFQHVLFGVYFICEMHPADEELLALISLFAVIGWSVMVGCQSSYHGQWKKLSARPMYTSEGHYWDWAWSFHQSKRRSCSAFATSDHKLWSSSLRKLHPKRRSSWEKITVITFVFISDIWYRSSVNTFKYICKHSYIYHHLNTFEIGKIILRIPYCMYRSSKSKTIAK